MRYLILIALLLTGCSVTGWSVLICPKSETTCKLSTVIFESKTECLNFIADMKRFQPDTYRLCISQTFIK